jgi:membrane protease YdiL (CAAX protease family)
VRAHTSASRAVVLGEPSVDTVTNRVGIVPASLPRLAVFLVATLATTWLAFLPMIMGVVDKSSTAGFFLLLAGIGAPSITAFVLTSVGEGRGGVRRLGRGGIRWRVPVRLYVAIVAIPGVAFGGSWLVGVATGAPAVIYPLVPALISGLLAGLLEEFGWTGLAFPALQARFGFLRAGAAMGVIVAVWHLPFFLLPGTTQNASSFAMFLLILVGARVVFGYLYNASGGSILTAILLHASGNSWGETLGAGSDTADPAGLTKLAVFAVAALAAVLITRRRQGHQPASTATLSRDLGR